VNKKRVFVARK